METISNDLARALCCVFSIVTAPAQQHATKPSVYTALFYTRLPKISNFHSDSKAVFNFKIALPEHFRNVYIGMFFFCSLSPLNIVVRDAHLTGEIKLDGLMSLQIEFRVSLESVLSQPRPKVSSDSCSDL